MAADGSFSLGLSTTVLPAAMAIGKNHIGTMAGKLKGLMMPTTPSGSRLEWTSTPVEASSLWPPLSRWEMPQANSTTSWPREISPIASECTLPCSAVMIAASSSLRLLSSSRKANITCVRRASEVVPQPRAARGGRGDDAAAASASLASATRPVTWPVAGLVTSAQPVGEPGSGGAVGPVHDLVSMSLMAPSSIGGTASAGVGS